LKPGLMAAILWKRALVLRVLDAAAAAAALHLASRLPGAPQPGWLMLALVAACYLLLFHAFDFYSPAEFENERVLTASVLTVGLANVLFIGITFAVYFIPPGRKVMLVLTMLMLVYAWLRARLVMAMRPHQRPVLYLVDLQPAQLPAGVRNRLEQRCRIVSTDGSDRTPPHDPDPNTIYVVNGNCDPDRLSPFLKLKLRGGAVFTPEAVMEHLFGQVPVDLLSPSFFLDRTGFDQARRRLPRVIKRTMDIMLAILVLTPSLPVMAVTWLLIRLESPGPGFFRQTRTGVNGKPFTIIKFRSMRNDAEKHGAQWARTNDPRITRIGRIIRKLRIDELPQLFNVLKGEMSFVGPRPERPEFDEELKQQLPFYMFRYLVKPGLTGWAQVNYGYGASVDDAREKLQYDLFYVKHYSLLMDLDILIRTVRTVFLAKGR